MPHYRQEHGGLKAAVPQQTNPCPEMDALISKLGYSRPSWEELDCHMNGLERLPMPATGKGIIIGSEVFGRTPEIPRLYFDLTEKLYSKYDVGMSSLSFPLAPPYADEKGRELSYPLEPRYLYEKLRAYAVMANTFKALTQRMNRMKRYSIVLKGRVQDVGFRSRIIGTAQIYGIRGYPPTNDLDGSVKMICEGPEKQIDKFLRDIDIREKPPQG